MTAEEAMTTTEDLTLTTSLWKRNRKGRSAREGASDNAGAGARVERRRPEGEPCRCDLAGGGSATPGENNFQAK